MKTAKSNVLIQQLVRDDKPEPDVWWGEDGIDALIWADGQPYGGPCGMSAQFCRTVMAGEPQ